MPLSLRHLARSIAMFPIACIQLAWYAANYTPGTDRSGKW